MQKMLSRKTFIKSMGIFAGFTLFPTVNSFSQINSEKISPEKIIPKRLKKGDLIGLVTPAGVITKKQLKSTIENVEKLGFKAYYEPSILSEYGYLAGTDQERANELMHMFTNKDVDCILCARGGYGAIRILDLLDFKQIAANPKILIGYSDITAFLSSIYEKSGLVTFHGPVGISSFNHYTTESFDDILVNPKKHYKYPYQREKDSDDNPEFDFYTITEGKAEGELIGGNMSVIVSMIGSKFETDFENKLVYLEEVGEKTYKVDRMLTQLLQATNLKKASGIVLGIFSDCDVNDEPTFSLKEILTQILKPLNIPVVYGFPFGHVGTKMTIPTGILAKFNANKKTLKLMEKTVL